LSDFDIGMDQCFGTGPNPKSLLGKGVPALEASSQTQLRTVSGSYPLPEGGRSFRSHGPAIEHLPLNLFQSAIEITIFSDSEILQMLQHCHTDK
jgi:hypothetical protein